jgi:hypothetical protein
MLLQELNLQEMNDVTGGTPVTRKEYCETLTMLMDHNYESWTLEERGSAIDAWMSADCDRSSSYYY